MKKAICVLLALACLLLCGCSFGVMTVGAYENADRYSVGGFAYDAAEVRAVEINWISGTVTLSESENAQLTVSEDESGLSDDQRLRWLLEDGTLRIQFCKAGYKGLFTGKKALALQIPQGVTLRVNTTSADVKMGDHALNELAVNTVSGNWQAGNLRAQSLSLNVVSADMKAGLIELRGEMQIGSVSGDLTVEAVKAQNVKIGTTSGDVSLALYQCGGAEIGTVSGDVRLYAPHDQGVRVEYGTASGKVNGQSQKRGSVVIGSGEAACLAQVNTVSGDITLGEK